MKNTSVYTNTQRDRKAQRLMKQTATVIQRGNTDRATFFSLFFLTGVICVGVKPQRYD